MIKLIKVEHPSSVVEKCVHATFVIAILLLLFRKCLSGKKS